jgi:hypothetical protein
MLANVTSPSGIAHTIHASNDVDTRPSDPSHRVGYADGEEGITSLNPSLD